MALTDVEVHTAKAVPKPVKLFDGGGLHLRIDPKGSKLWRLAYRFDEGERVHAMEDPIPRGRGIGPNS